MYMFTFNAKTNTVSGTLTPIELIGLMKVRPSRAYNNSRQSEVCCDDSKSNTCWVGGTVADVSNPPNMAKFQAALILLQMTKLKNLKTTAGTANIRRRVLSEHDGDWSLERQWDLKPFNATKREPSTVRIVKIVANMTFPVSYSSTQIDEFGATVWALSQIIESRGIQASVEALCHTRQQHLTKLLVPIKDSRKYVSPQELATVFRSVFVRRAMYTGLIHAYDSQGWDVEPSLGSAIMFPNNVEYIDGELRMNIGALGDFKAVETELQKILGA